MPDKKILITGGAGFVGSSIGIAMKSKYPDYEVIALDNLKRRGSELNLPRLRSAGVRFIHGDIRNKEDLEDLPRASTVIEASAEPSVLAGIHSSPEYLMNTNLVGAINCLNYAVRCEAEFLFLSTSRVYPIESIEQIATDETEFAFALSDRQSMPGVSANGISEDFPLTGSRSLYGASKLASELIINEYHAFYGLPAVINRCGVLTGPWQMGKTDQGVVVLWVAKHHWQGSLSYIGYKGAGKQVRDILHVADLFRLIDIQLHDMPRFSGMTFNVGGGSDNSVSLAQLTLLCRQITGKRIPIDRIDETRPADVKIVVIDNSKIHTACGWRPEVSIRETVEDIEKWILNNESLLAPILS